MPTAYEAIHSRGDTLIALMYRTSVSYFIYKGQIQGYEYEMLNKFTERYHLHLHIKLVEHPDSLIPMLNRGEGDLIAHCMRITKSARKEVNFTKRFYESSIVLVQRKPYNWFEMSSREIDKRMLRNILDIGQKPINITQDSIYFPDLINLEDVVGDTLNIIATDSVKTSYNLMQMIADGKLKYTVAEWEEASILANYVRNIDIKTDICMPYPKAWAVRKNSPQLLRELNAWLNYYQRYKEYFYIFDKYYKNHIVYKKITESPYSSMKGKLSPYDDIIKKETERLNWDWRLIAALIYQESHFDQSLESPKGAVGLMQVLPSTAEMHGFKNPYHANTNVRAGITHLMYIEKQFVHLDSLNRIKFTLASYNVGLGHIYDAQRLATYLGLDSTQWDGNVAEALLMKRHAKYYNLDICRNGYCRGTETYNYVNNILERYESYKQLIE